MSRLALILALAATPALAACSDDSTEPVEAVSPSEAKALDEAAEMLEERRLPPDAATDGTTTDGQAAEGETAQ